MLKYIIRNKLYLGILGGGSISTLLYLNNNIPKYNVSNKIYTPEQVETHNKLDDFWVTYKGGVYDITNFLHGHPGGIDKIKMAAGGPLEPYWELYNQHNNDKVKQLLDINMIKVLQD